MSNKKTLIIFIALLLVLPAVLASFEAKSSSTDVCPTSTLVLTSTLKNTDSNPKSYTMSKAGTAASFSTVLPLGFILNSGQEKIIYTYVTPRSTTSPGTYELTILANEEQLAYQIKVRDCNSLSMQGDGSKTTCACKPVEYSYVLTNPSQYQDIYTINLTGSAAKFSTLSQSQFSIIPGTTAILKLISQVPCSTAEGDYDLILTAVSSKVPATSSFTSRLAVQDCYSYDISPQKDYVSMCEYTVESIPITINNQGNTQNTYNIYVFGPAWANVEEDKVSIAAGSSYKTNLVLSPTYGVEGSFDITLRVSSATGDIQQENIFKADVKKCHGVLLEISEDSAKICKPLSETYNVLIKNEGEFEKSFKLEASQPFATFSEKEIKLAAKSEKTIVLTIAPLETTLPSIYDIKLKATALDDSKISAEDAIKAEIIKREDCYMPSLTSQKDSLLVNFDSSSVLELTIKNNGGKQADYTLSLSGTAASFSQLNPAVVSLDPLTSSTIYLYIAPSAAVDEGKYELEVSAKYQDETLASKKITVEVTKKAISAEPTAQSSLWSKFKNWMTGLFAAPTEPPVINQTTLTPVVQDNKTADGAAQSKMASTLSKYKYYITGALAAILLLLILYKFGFFKKLSDFLEEEDIEDTKKSDEETGAEIADEEYKEEKKAKEESGIFKWIVGLIILAILIYFGWKYNGLEYVKTYKYYVLGVVAALLLILILVRTGFFKKMSDFFEEDFGEDEDEPKKPEVKEIKKEIKREEPKKKPESKFADDEEEDNDDLDFEIITDEDEEEPIAREPKKLKRGRGRPKRI